MDPLFEVHKLNPEGMAKARFIAESFNILLDSLKTVCRQDTREFSIVRTKLEEACFFSKKTMAMEPGSQEK